MKNYKELNGKQCEPFYTEKLKDLLSFKGLHLCLFVNNRDEVDIFICSAQTEEPIGLTGYDEIDLEIERTIIKIQNSFN